MLIVEQVYFGISQSQGQICILLLELIQKETAWHVLTGSKPGAATECGRGFHLHLRGSGDLMAPSFQKCLPVQPYSHNVSCRIKPLCHWVSKSYLSGHEVIWSHSSLFKNGALPHQLVLGGLVVSEGGQQRERGDESLSVGADKCGVGI